MLFLILLLAVALWALKVLKFHVTKKRQRLLALAAQVPSDKAALPFIGHAYKFIGGSKFTSAAPKLAHTHSCHALKAERYEAWYCFRSHKLYGIVLGTSTSRACD
ncbi:hypothetical protein MSG28_014233 [Choristoneura fumiferana]|uniref:Uncharacterized protein n=1 Tax=Choristoneura fumiferana TaxID=7141 RepID=A0ACC0JGB8_CHOFU|nr:hypothetical protein MSG28_014233 [Choristoneura fumiferana]